MKNQAVRILAFDINGRKFFSDYSGGPTRRYVLGPIIYELGPSRIKDASEKVGLPLKNIARVTIQVRPYHYVIFKNVHLQPEAMP